MLNITLYKMVKFTNYFSSRLRRVSRTSLHDPSNFRGFIWENGLHEQIWDYYYIFIVWITVYLADEPLKDWNRYQVPFYRLQSDSELNMQIFSEWQLFCFWIILKLCFFEKRSFYFLDFFSQNTLPDVPTKIKAA